jgi:dsRNA-specific ribonuclease
MFWNLTKASSGIMTQLRIELVKKIVYVEHLEIQKCQIYGASLENLSENILVESFNALFGLLYYAKGLEFCRSFLLQLIDECKQKFVQGSAHNENAGIMKHLDSFLRKENFDILRINHLKDLSSQKSSDLGMKLQEKRLDELEDHIGIDFQNKLLLLKCLIPESYHTSYPTNYGSNDRLELYGDSILDYLICELIVLFCPNADSEILDGARQHLTSNESLCGIAKSIRLHEFIVSRIPIREDSNSKVIADALEALFGAIQIEHGILACRIFVLQHFSNPLAKFLRDSRVKNARFCLEFAISRLLHNLGITAESANFPSHLFTLNITPKSDLLYCSVYLYDNTLLSEGIGITQEQAAISSSWGALSILLQKHAISLFSPTGHPPTLNYISRQKTHFLATYTQFEQMISFGYTSNINQNGFWAFTC